MVESSLIAPVWASISKRLAVLACLLSLFFDVATISARSQTIQLTATDPDGANTQTARLGVPINFTTAVPSSPTATRNWTMQGGGAFHSGGTYSANAVYTPPQTMPANPSVTVTVSVATTPAVTQSYTMTLINPAPAVSGATPAQVISGGTQTIALAGSGFVPGMVVLFNGQSLPTTFTDYGHAAVQISVGANATGTLSLQVENPAPGGGAGTTFTEAVLPASIALTATDPDGTNTGTARLGVPVNFTTSVTNSPAASRSWTMQGVGAFHSGGTYSANAVYTPPQTMPANASVTMTAYLTSSPAITTSYIMALVNPTPIVTSASPTQLLTGGPQTVYLAGSGFVSGMVVILNGKALPITLTDYGHAVVQIPVAANGTGTLTLQAQNPAPGGGLGTTFSEAIAATSLTLTGLNAAGTITSQAPLGSPVLMGATASGTLQSTVTWSLTGAGTLSNNGVYTAPATLPSNTSVTITAALVSNPAITASYTLQIVNPVPSLISANPPQLLTGGSQLVSLVGANFVPGTTVTVNGTALSTTYVDYSHVTVLVPVAANATGSLTLGAQNPAPGGGTGSTLTESIAPVSITLSATNPNGTSTTTAGLGIGAIMTATVTGSLQTAVTWSVPYGSISTGGVYMVKRMPESQQVTVEATLASNPAITASYLLQIVNPVPAIDGASPLQVPVGATTALTLTGAGFVPQTVILVNGAEVPTTYQSATSVVVQVSVAAGAAGNLSLQAANPTPGGGTGSEFEEAITTPISPSAAARLLDQTTFGPTSGLIQQVAKEGVTAWLQEQFYTPQTTLATNFTPPPTYCGDISACVQSDWWQAVLTGDDQLRQRVAFTLSELFVVSDDTVLGQAVAPYANLLASDAFSNWYTIMNDVTLSPAMGIYLNMLDSVAATGSQIANENYARENMQLFNLGLILLNQDGSPQLDGNGNLQSTYTEDQVQAFARAYTGWTYANPDGSVPTLAQIGSTHNYDHAMVPIESWHDETAKSLLNETTLPAGQTAEMDLAGALTNIFQHPNLPPFVSKQLIQHLVTSNPSAGYVSRVAAVFADNGNQVRGDMKAVLTAIFTDPEARAGDTDAAVDGGHLREPMLWMTAVMRGLGYVNVDPNDYYQMLTNYSAYLDELPYGADSVFNFFPPSYVVPGTTLSGPEFALENTGSVTERLTVADRLVNNNISGFNVDLSATSPLGQTASSPSALVDALGALFMHAQMDPNVRQAIINEISSLTDPAQQVRVAAYLVITSSQYKNLH
jgi:uncharacterized protein (DUF1800 family)